MALKTCEMWSDGSKKVFFPKNYKKSPGGWGLCPQTPSCDTFELHYFTQQVPQFRHFHFLNYWFEPFFLSGILVTCQPQATGYDLLFYKILAPKKILSKFLMMSLRVICGLPPFEFELNWWRILRNLSIWRNVAAVGDRWQHCVRFDRSEIWTLDHSLQRRTRYRSTKKWNWNLWTLFKNRCPRPKFYWFL